jgi:dienelactone hydrolase
MRSLTLGLVVAGMLAVAVGAQAPQGTPAGSTQAVTPSATTREPEPPGPPVPLGPYAAVTIDAAEGLPTHTVYRPTDLSAFPSRDKLPIVVWGNGACSMDGLYFQGYLTKLASHGFVVVVAGRKDQRERDAAARGAEPVVRGAETAARGAQPATPPAAGRGGPPTDTSGRATGPMLIQAIDWAVKENGRAGSPLRGKIDTESVAMMGMSCGGLMAIESAHDPRVDTLVIWNSGVFNVMDQNVRSLSAATKQTLATIHTNVAYFNGGTPDIAYENSNDDVSRINHVPVFYGVKTNAGHGATFRHANGGKFAEVGANWLMWRLKGDKKAGAMFEGPNCGLCTDLAWTVQKKKMD